MVSKPLNPTDQKPGAYVRYPLSMRRGQHPNIESRLAQNEEDELAAIESGWSTKCPPIPPPEEPKPELTQEERLAAIEAAIADLTTAMEDLQSKKGKR